MPNGIGQEYVWARHTGSVNPHVETTSGDANGIEYTTKTYVTVPAGITLDSAGQPYQKRLTIVATWTAYGETRERVDLDAPDRDHAWSTAAAYGVTPTSVTTLTQNAEYNPHLGIPGGQPRRPGHLQPECVSRHLDLLRRHRLRRSSRRRREHRADQHRPRARQQPADTGKLEPNNNPPFCVTAQRAIPVDGDGHVERDLQLPVVGPAHRIWCGGRRRSVHRHRHQLAQPVEAPLPLRAAPRRPRRRCAPRPLQEWERRSASATGSRRRTATRPPSWSTR